MQVDPKTVEQFAHRKMSQDFPRILKKIKQRMGKKFDRRIARYQELIQLHAASNECSTSDSASYILNSFIEDLEDATEVAELIIAAWTDLRIQETHECQNNKPPMPQAALRSKKNGSGR